MQGGTAGSGGVPRVNRENMASYTLGMETSQTPLVGRTVTLLQRTLCDRADLAVCVVPAAQADLVLGLRPGIGAEGFCIESTPRGVRICGADERGLLYGVGKFLHTSQLSPGGFVPSSWRGTSVPSCRVRGMYLAYNFKNWYVSAPREDVLRYAEELALWGLNALAFVPAHVQHAAMDAPETPELRQTLSENTQLMQELRMLGFSIGLLAPGNVCFAHVPPGAEAADVPDTTPARRGNVNPRVCPSHPAGWAHLEKTYARVFDGYREVGVDYLISFPYDAGGCGCPECWPWGPKGFLRLNQMLGRLAHERFPDCKLVFGSWCFDALGAQEGEWAGVAEAFAQDASWVHYVMADGHEDFPRYPLEHGVPGGLPLLNFAEISMWGRYPWGGYGANPLPARFQRLWNQIRPVCDGGFPYSEGIFEDMNKALCAGFYWNRDAAAEDTLREYISYEFGPAVVESVLEAVRLLEKSYPRSTWQRADVERACELILAADRQLPERVRQGWRWRILYLRAVIDVELITHPGQPHSDRCDAAYEELTRIYWAENTGGPDAPPSRRCQARLAAAAAPPPGSDEK